MSGLYENLIFPRGDTYGESQAAPPTSLDSQEKIHQDVTYNTNMYVKVRACRNISGIALLPGRAVKFKPVAGQGWSQVIGYCTVVGEYTGIVDELLPPAGVANGDVFWVVVEGPCLATLPPGGATVAVGDALWAATAAASTAGTDSGRLADAQALLAGGTATAVQHVFGFAMSAAASTAASTAPSYMLVNAGPFTW